MTDELKETMIEKAIEFYGGMALHGEYVINTEVGFINEDGSQVFEQMPKELAQTYHEGNEVARKALEIAGHDSQEMMQYSEHILIVNKVLGTNDYQPEYMQMSPPTDLLAESEDLRNARRAAHLFHCVKTAAMACQPDVVFMSDDGSGFGINSTDAHPLLRMYVDSMDSRMIGEHIKQGEEMMKSDDITDFLNDEIAQLQGDDIDPDSDENDDDPFRGYA